MHLLKVYSFPLIIVIELIVLSSCVMTPWAADGIDSNDWEVKNL